jgi:hypothetical protein
VTVSTPDEIVKQQLADGLEVTGEVAAGVYGDPAGAAAPAADLDLSKAAPAAADVDELRARLASLEAVQQAAAPPPPEPPDLTPVLSPTVASDVREAFQRLHERILAIEEGLGL